MEKEIFILEGNPNEKIDLTRNKKREQVRNKLLYKGKLLNTKDAKLPNN